MLDVIRSRNHNLPVFLMAGRRDASEVPVDILDKVNDFIWILEDTTDFISGRIMAAVEHYREFVLPPMFKALAAFAKVHEYSWHTPGHTGGTAFLKSTAGLFSISLTKKFSVPTCQFRSASSGHCWITPARLAKAKNILPVFSAPIAVIP